MLCKTLNGVKDLELGEAEQVPGQDLVDVWEVHLKAVLILVRLEGHSVELSSGLEFRNSCPIEFQVSKGCLIRFTVGESTAREVDMM
jgi:hypothetical protein